MKSKVLDQKGKEVDLKLSLDKSVWDIVENLDLIAQALYVLNSNKRRGTANAKSRGEVSGGGKKPWRQKGTGRARAGSSRSPLWVKGGVHFTPNDRNWKKKLNEKMKKKAIASVLSSKLRNENLKFVSFSKKVDFKKLREDAVKLFENKKTLVVSDKEDVFKPLQNVETIKIAKPLNLNIYDALDNVNIFVDYDAVKIIEERLRNEK